MPQLSAVIITFNEEKNIGRCIESLRSIADEIIIVDSFSTDNTEQICKSYKNVKFILHPFKGHIQQKNFALSQASNNLIFSLDADETPDNVLIKSISNIKNDQKFDGYYMNRLTNYCGKWIKHCGWYPDRKLRVFDKSKTKWVGTNPHDRAELISGKISKIKGNILHYSFYTIGEHVKQQEFFSEISAKELFSRGKKPNIYHLYFKPKLRFIVDYLWKGGFRDGFMGYVICTNQAYGKFLIYAKLKMMGDQKNSKKQD